MRILLVEDEEALADGMRVGLAAAGFTADWVPDGYLADQALRLERFDLMILDLGLPRMSGLDVLRALRTRGDRLPVLILTARAAIAERIEGLDSGADDYLVKPFDLDELGARVRALLRRSRGRAAPLFKRGAITLDPAAHTVRFHDKALDLPPREFALLEMLLENAGQVLSQSRLEEALYGWAAGVESNTVEVYVHNLRKRFGNDLIRTLRGVGYMIPKET